MTNTALIKKFREAIPVEVARNGAEFDQLIGQVRDLLSTVNELEDLLGELRPRPERPRQTRAARVYDLGKVLAPEN